MAGFFVHEHGGGLVKYVIKFTETPKNCKECKHWDANNRSCKLKRCEYKAKQ